MASTITLEACNATYTLRHSPDGAWYVIDATGPQIDVESLLGEPFYTGFPPSIHASPSARSLQRFLNTTEQT